MHIYASLGLNELTQWGWDKMVIISQTSFSNAFSWMKMCEFLFKFHRRLFLMLQWTIFQHWFRQWLGTNQATSHYVNKWWLIYWCIHVSLGLNELTYSSGQELYFHSILNSMAVYQSIQDFVIFHKKENWDRDEKPDMTLWPHYHLLVHDDIYLTLFILHCTHRNNGVNTHGANATSSTVCLRASIGTVHPLE